MTLPPVWTREQLDRQRKIAIANFRRERADEPRDDYTEAFDQYQTAVEELLEETVDLTQWNSAAFTVITKPDLFEAFRYVAAPPISEDDLKILAEVPSLAKNRLKDRPYDVKKISETIASVFDTRRFVWLRDNREANESERSAAVLASAALLAASRVLTSRRHSSKQKQEEVVAATLETLSFKRVKARRITNFAHAPSRGQFCGETSVAGRKADLVLRAWDDRVVPIECKVSNSEVNSTKRLNNDAAVKAAGWKTALGADQVVPVAVLSGVYSLSNLLVAQECGLTLVWAHDMSPFAQWIQSTKVTRKRSR